MIDQNRMGNIYGEQMPDWAQQFKQQGDFNAMNLSPYQQKSMFLSDMMMAPGSDAGFESLVSGNTDLAEFWADHWWKGDAADRANRISSFRGGY